MKLITLLLTVMFFQVARAENMNYEVAQGQTVDLDLFQNSLRGELEMACNAELDTSSTCHIKTFQITGLRPFYNLQNRAPASNVRSYLHIIDISLNTQLVRCNVEFSTESKTIDLKDCESSSLKAKLFEQITNVGYKQAGFKG